jgi:hypothetical protein
VRGTAACFAIADWRRSETDDDDEAVFLDANLGTALKLNRDSSRLAGRPAALALTACSYYPSPSAPRGARAGGPDRRSAAGLLAAGRWPCAGRPRARPRGGARATRTRARRTEEIQIRNLSD